MALQFDPRGDLPTATTRSMSYIQSRPSFLYAESRVRSRNLSSLSLTTRLRTKPCLDWVFSSVSNVHIALDKSAFKEYTAFESYVLTLSDHRPLHVKGVGSVELKIRRRPDSKESHTILLTDVLHVPDWLCNIFSDVYFSAGHEFEHMWTSSGVRFSKKEQRRSKPWGYTESFCSLDRLVLAKHHKDSRSPMLEDKDREVFSVNVVWPHAQRNRWERYLLDTRLHRPFRAFSEIGLSTVKSPSKMELKMDRHNTVSGVVTRRATLSDLNANIVNRAPSKRVGGLRAALSQRELVRASA